MTIQATYTKLKTGEWGIRVTGFVGAMRDGAEIMVAKKSGESRAETIGRTVWTDGKVAICTIGAKTAARNTQYGYDRLERDLRNGKYGYTASLDAD